MSPACHCRRSSATSRPVNRGRIMTRGERIAWIWVWSVIVVISATIAFAARRYWALPYLHLEAHICEMSMGAAAVRACDRVIANEQTPDRLRRTALRSIANARSDWKTVTERLTQLMEMGEVTAEDWNVRGLAYYSLREYEKAAEDFAQAAQSTRPRPSIGPPSAMPSSRSRNTASPATTTRPPSRRAKRQPRLSAIAAGPAMSSAIMRRASSTPDFIVSH